MVIVPLVCTYLKHGPAMPLKIHVAAPCSTNSERLTARPAREGFVIIWACTKPIGAGMVSVCVERGRPKWPVTMLTDTKKHTEKIKKAPYTPRMTRCEAAFLFRKPRKKRLHASRFVCLIITTPVCHSNPCSFVSERRGRNRCTGIRTATAVPQQ